MRYLLDGLNCPNCAAKIEAEIKKIPGLEQVELNFATKTIDLPPGYEQEVQAIIERIEKGVVLRPYHEEGEEKENKIAPLLPIGLAALFFLAGFAAENFFSSFSSYLFYGVAYLLVGWKVIVRAGKNFFRGFLFDESFLMTVSTLGAIVLREMPEAVGVMLFYSLGEYLQDLAVAKSRRSIRALMNIRPERARVRRGDRWVEVAPAEVKPGELILVQPGEKIPLDGRVVRGLSFVDTSPLTGESLPQRVEAGEEVRAGTINGGGVLEIEVLRPYEESAVARIMQLVEEAAGRKSPTERFITTFARYYTPAVVAAAVTLALVPPLFGKGSFQEWSYRALVLLVISCPCALMVSIPLGYFGGIGAAARGGILVKGGNFLDGLTVAHTVVFDKTGTLTEGVFAVTSVHPAPGYSEKDVLYWAATAEVHSHHPLARSLLRAFTGESLPEAAAGDYREVGGLGVHATVEGHEVLVGTSRLLSAHGVVVPYQDFPDGTAVHVAVDGKYIGSVILADRLKEGVGRVLTELRELGIKKLVLLSGDSKRKVQELTASLNFDEAYGELLPEDKVRITEELMSRLPGKRTLIFVGDGINDAPVIMRAHVGIAMGGLGSQAAVEAADVVIMDDDPEKVAQAIRTARFTRRVVKQNIVMALAVKGLFLLGGSLGLAGMWEAVFADVGVALLAVFNSLRLIRRVPREKGELLPAQI